MAAGYRPVLAYIGCGPMLWITSPKPVDSCGKPGDRVSCSFTCAAKCAMMLNMGRIPGVGLAKGLSITLRHMLRKSVTQQYPEVKPALPPRSRGVIALVEENCTSCMLCARECPDWCIYIDSHKETIPAPEGGRPRQRNVLDRFAIDFALCMYCGICIEVCPFDALFWSPEFEYAEGDIRNLLHEKDRLATWVPTVPPPPAHDPGAEPPKELTAAPRRPGAAPARPASSRRPRPDTPAPPASTRQPVDDTTSTEQRPPGTPDKHTPAPSTPETTSSGTSISGTSTPETTSSGSSTSGTSISETTSPGSSTSGTSISETTSSEPLTSGTASSGPITSGTSTSGSLPSGAPASGAAVPGTATSETAPSGSAPAETTSAETVSSEGAASEDEPSGAVTSGDVSRGTASSETAAPATASQDQRASEAEGPESGASEGTMSEAEGPGTGTAERAMSEAEGPGTGTAERAMSEARGEAAGSETGGEPSGAGPDRTPPSERPQNGPSSTGKPAEEELSTASGEPRPDPGSKEQTAGPRPRRRRMADPRSIRPPGRLDPDGTRESEEDS
ncbi:4Fe-4S binding protein [Nonomuraea sp. NPDC048916]|uniref:NuoI/complex I 23 kDa subunit family protein n=1 Tax=Nonomuraea sp. NPDC048916 TaxID=3154232 RepID=UPI0033D42A28